MGFLQEKKTFSWNLGFGWCAVVWDFPSSIFHLHLFSIIFVAPLTHEWLISPLLGFDVTKLKLSAASRWHRGSRTHIKLILTYSIFVFLAHTHSHYHSLIVLLPFFFFFMLVLVYLFVGLYFNFAHYTLCPARYCCIINCDSTVIMNYIDDRGHG